MEKPEKFCCYTCEDEWRAADSQNYRWGHRTFIVCPDCGNKRCPKANHHDNACTGSNETGQKGSRYE